MWCYLGFNWFFHSEKDFLSRYCYLYPPWRRFTLFCFILFNRLNSSSMHLLVYCIVLSKWFTLLLTVGWALCIRGPYWIYPILIICIGKLRNGNLTCKANLKNMFVYVRTSSFHAKINPWIVGTSQRMIAKTIQPYHNKRSSKFKNFDTFLPSVEFGRDSSILVLTHIELYVNPTTFCNSCIVWAFNAHKIIHI